MGVLCHEGASYGLALAIVSFGVLCGGGRSLWFFVKNYYSEAYVKLILVHFHDSF